MTLEEQQVKAHLCINKCQVGHLAQTHRCLLKNHPGAPSKNEPGPCLPLALNKLCSVLERLTPPAQGSYHPEPEKEPEGEPPDYRLLDRQRDLVRFCVNHCMVKDDSGRQFNDHGCLLSSPAKACVVHQGKLCQALFALYPAHMAAPDEDESDNGQL